MDDSFHFGVTHVRNPGRGSGRDGRLKLGTKHIKEKLKSKKSVIVINNYSDIRGLPVQGTFLRELHELAGVPGGPCGLNEIALLLRLLNSSGISISWLSNHLQRFRAGGRETVDFDQEW